MGRDPKCLVRWSHPSVQQRHKPNQGQRLSAYVNADLLSSNMLSLASTRVESLGSCLATRIFHVCQLNQRSKCTMQHLETLCEFIKFSGGLWVHKAVNWLQATEAIIFSSATKAATLPYCSWHVKRHSASTHSSQQAENRLARRRLWEAAGLCHLESQQRQFSTERKMHDKYKQLFRSGSACECVHSYSKCSAAPSLNQEIACWLCCQMMPGWHRWRIFSTKYTRLTLMAYFQCQMMPGWHPWRIFNTKQS